MSRRVVDRPEMLSAHLDLGGSPIDLADYATTGLMAVAVGPRGYGKTNTGLLIAEQLSAQGWVSVLIDPEEELAALYGEAVKDAGELLNLLTTRSKPIIVVHARDATEFVPYGEAILQASDTHRKPVFVMIDEGQLFSSTRKREQDVGRASDIVNEFAGRGRKRALDMFITALRYTGTLHRSLFSNKNLTLVGCQEDPTVWSALAPQFRSSNIEFTDLNTLSPGEFFCFSRGGVEKVRMPMAGALQKVARAAKKVKRALPTNFRQWDRAMSEITTERLETLTDPALVQVLAAVAGLTPQQIATGNAALEDELACR